MPFQLPEFLQPHSADRPIQKGTARESAVAVDTNARHIVLRAPGIEIILIHCGRLVCLRPEVEAKGVQENRHFARVGHIVHVPIAFRGRQIPLEGARFRNAQHIAVETVAPGEAVAVHCIGHAFVGPIPYF